MPALLLAEGGHLVTSGVVEEQQKSWPPSRGRMYSFGVLGTEGKCLPHRCASSLWSCACVFEKSEARGTLGGFGSWCGYCPTCEQEERAAVGAGGEPGAVPAQLAVLGAVVWEQHSALQQHRFFSNYPKYNWDFKLHYI